MKKECNAYTTEQISRFMDNELPPDLGADVKTHLDQCEVCRQQLCRYQSVSTAVKEGIGRIDLAIDPATIRPGSGRPVFGKLLYGFGQNIYLKLASVAAIVVISLVTFQSSLFSPAPAGPSAIVKSVDTEYTSVMIIETQKKKHTIIWFSET